MNIENIVLIDSSIPTMSFIMQIKSGKLVDIDFEMDSSVDIIGNIYLGKVVNVLQSLSAYFIDYGDHRNGFLPFSCALTNLKRDDNVIVQVTKNTKDSKGARLSCFIQMIGQYSILMPYGTQRNRTYNEHIITKQNNVDYSIIAKDLDNIRQRWVGVLNKSKKQDPSTILYQEHRLIQRILRDKYSQTTVEIHVDGKHEFLSVQKMVADMGMHHIVKEYRSTMPLFDKFGMNKELINLTNRSIELESGGSIAIDVTEAMVSIDINSASCSSGDLEQTSFKVNSEAAIEIAKQIRLRDLSGLISIDYIDMYDQNNVKQIENIFKSAMQYDDSLSKIANINEFGVMMLSRQRSNLNIYQQLYTKVNSDISYSFIPNTYWLAFQIISAIRLSIHTNPKQIINVECDSNTADYILNDLRSTLFHLESNNTKVKVKVNPVCINSFNIDPVGKVTSNEIIKYSHPIIETRKSIARLMQDLPIFDKSYIVQIYDHSICIGSII